MSTEADNTNSAVIATMLAIGTAAMLGGSAAIVALARSEMQDNATENQAYADLNTVRELKTQQRARLDSAKLPIAKAEAALLADLARDPKLASPPAPPSEPAPTAAEGAAPEAAPAEGEGAANDPEASPDAPAPKEPTP